MYSVGDIKATMPEYICQSDNSVSCLFKKGSMWKLEEGHCLCIKIINSIGWTPGFSLSANVAMLVVAWLPFSFF